MLKNSEKLPKNFMKELSQKEFFLNEIISFWDCLIERPVSK